MLSPRQMKAYSLPDRPGHRAQSGRVDSGEAGDRRNRSVRNRRRCRWTNGQHDPFSQIALAIERNPDGSIPAKLGPKEAPSLPMDQWTTWTYSQYYEETRNAAKGMISYGLERFGSVAIFGFNAPEW